MIGLPPGTTHDMLRADADAARPANVRRDRLAQFRQTLRRTVVRPAFIERVLGGVDDMAVRSRNRARRSRDE